MSAPFVAALEEEIANLEKELSENITYRRLAEAKRMLALYVSRPSPQTSTLRVRPMPAYPTRVRAVQAVRQRSSERVKALDAARLFLANRTGEPIPTAEIYDHIVSLGIQVPGNEPRNNLSAML